MCDSILQKWSRDIIPLNRFSRHCAHWLSLDLIIAHGLTILLTLLGTYLQFKLGVLVTEILYCIMATQLISSIVHTNYTEKTQFLILFTYIVIIKNVYLLLCNIVFTSIMFSRSTHLCYKWWSCTRFKQSIFHFWDI